MVRNRQGSTSKIKKNNHPRCADMSAIASVCRAGRHGEIMLEDCYTQPKCYGDSKSLSLLMYCWMCILSIQDCGEELKQLSIRSWVALVQTVMSRYNSLEGNVDQLGNDIEWSFGYLNSHCNPKSMICAKGFLA